MDYDNQIPDIYESNKNEKYIMKTHIIKLNQRLYISEIFDNFNTNYIYIETNSTQLFFDGNNGIYTRIYNKIIKNLLYVRHILNKSNNNAYIKIYIMRISELKHVYFFIYFFVTIYNIFYF